MCAPVGGGEDLIPPSSLTSSGVAGAGASAGVGTHRSALRAAETPVSFSRAGKAVLSGTYLRPSTFGQLLSSRPTAYLPSVARSYSRPGPLRLFPFARHRKVFPQRRAPGDHLSRPPPRAAAGVDLLMLEVARGGTSLPPPFPTSLRRRTPSQLHR